MPEAEASCFISGHFTLQNGKRAPMNQSFDADVSDSDIVTYVYDTTITATSGCTMTVKLFVTGLEIFANGLIICAITKGGPVHPFGYLMHVVQLLPPQSRPSLYHEIESDIFGWLSTIGRVVSPATRTYNGNISFDLETTTNINGNVWKWVLRCVIPSYSITFTPVQNSCVKVFGFILNFLSVYNLRRLELDVLRMTHWEN